MKAAENRASLRLGHARARGPARESSPARQFHLHCTARRRIGKRVVQQVDQCQHDRRMIAGDGRHRAGSASISSTRWLIASGARPEIASTATRCRLTCARRRAEAPPAAPWSASARPAASCGRRPRGAPLLRRCSGRASMRAVSTASGVRRACAASPTKRRCAASACSSLASAWFIAPTSGITSSGRPACRQPHAGMQWSDPTGGGRRLAQRTQPVADRQHADQHRRPSDRHQQPQRAQQEIVQQALHQGLVLLLGLGGHDAPGSDVDDEAKQPVRIGRRRRNPEVAGPGRDGRNGRTIAATRGLFVAAGSSWPS